MYPKLLQKIILALCSLLLALCVSFSVAEVPVPSANFSTNDGGRTLIDVTGTSGQQAMRLIQPDKFNTYNWDSFNIGAGDSLTFQQPSDDSTALNYIHQNSISKIAGQLNANGNVYLINQNGFLFGEGAIVNVGSLIASVLNIDEQMLEDNGLVQSMYQQKPAFFADGDLVDENGKPYKIELEKGAQINTEGGRVLLVAPEILNSGSISTPDGQAILAASNDEVYLAASTDPDLRGLFVEVNDGGNVLNRGEIIAERGNISILGMAINQQGLLRATTSVDVNGSIRLLARDTLSSSSESITSPSSRDKYLWGSATADGALELSGQGNTFSYMRPSETGSVIFSSGSVTEVVPDAQTGSKLAPNGQDQRISHIDVMGNEITVKQDASLIATGGEIQMAATASPNALKGAEFDENDANEKTALRIEAGALLDVSGSNDAVVEMSRNQLTVKVAGNELRDSPLQKEGVLKGEEIYVDIRESEEIPIADISGAVDKIEKSIHERLAHGGEIALFSTGDMQVMKGSQLDVSGGSVHFNAGYIFESKLVSNGKLIPVSKADPLRDYQAILNQGERLNSTWKVIEKYDSFVLGGESIFVSAYRQGKDAGSINITANPSGNNKAFQFEGTVLADTFIGPYQRQQHSQPFGGSLNLDFRLSESGIANVMIANEEFIRESLASQMQVEANESPAQVYIADTLTSASVDNLSIKSNANLNLDKSAELNMDGAGSLHLSSFDTLTLAGKITNHGGNVTLSAVPKETGNPSPDTRIEIESGSQIDVSGLWVNDTKIPGVNTELSAINIDGGNVSLQAYGSVLLQAASSIVADGGAHLNNKGKLADGVGGDISLTAGNFDNNPDAVLDINPLAELRSQALSKGGTLALTARGFQVGADATSREVVRVETGRMPLEFERLKQGGFKNYILDAKQSGVAIQAADPAKNVVTLETENYYLASLRDGSEYESGLSPMEVKSGAVLADFAKSIELHQGLSRPVNLNIRSRESQIADDSTITLEKNSALHLLPGATLAFSSDDSIDLHGSIYAPGGELSFILNQAQNEQSHNDQQAIRVFNTARIDVSAFAQLMPEDGSFEKYKLFNAGSISLAANRGYILGQGGSKSPNLIADGADVTLVNQNTYLATGDTDGALENVALDAGSIYLRAAEGIIFDGVMTAKAASNPGARGGALELVLNANPRLVGSGVIGFDTLNSYANQNASGSIVIQDEQPDGGRLDDVMNNQSITSALDEQSDLAVGQAYVNISDVREGGFDRLALRAINNTGGENVNNAVSDIRFDTDSPLRLSEALILDAPSILVENHAAQLEANYLQIGTTTMLPGQVATRGVSLVSAESGTFSAQAGFVDFIGASEFSDAKSVSIYSDNDIRLIGRTQEPIPNEGAALFASQRELPSGQLYAYGDLSLSASQIFPTTATQFSILLPESGSVFKTAATGAAAPVISAQGVLNIEADVIEHGGVIKAPFGQINIDANESIALKASSVLSVSGEDQIIPFGLVTDDGVWHYTIAESSAAARPLLINAQNLKDKSIRLRADNIDYAREARVDISGGGDLLAYKWTKGRGGSFDVLSADYPGESFAVLPGYGNGVSGRYGIYDPQIEGGALPQVGRTVILEGTEGLAAGEYAVLPARYAMMPGAYLVTPAGVAGSTTSGNVARRIDGAEIVAGQFAFAQSDARDSQWRAFVVEPGEIANTRSQYDYFLASQFFHNDENIGRLAFGGDAGNLSLIAGASLNLEGELLAQTKPGGMGARLDISADEINVVAKKDGTETGIALLDTDLNRLEVESLLLGADRSATAEGMALNVSADEVVIGQGVSLQLPEVLLAAKERVEVSASASIESQAGAVGEGGRARIVGDGAFLQVSDGGAWNVIRENSTGQNGDLIVEASSRLFGQGSLALEASHSVNLAGQFDTAGELNFSAYALQLGNKATAAEKTLVLSQAQLESLTASRFRFKAQNVLSIDRGLSLSADQIILDAPSLLAVGEGAKASFTGEEALVLANSSTQQPLSTSSSAATGSLYLNSKNVTLESGEGNGVSILGFTSVFMGDDAPSDTAQSAKISANGNMELHSDADLTLRAGVLTVSVGDTLSINTKGGFTLNSDAGLEHQSVNEELGLGGKIYIDADDIFINSLIRANSGYISASAKNALSLGEYAALDVSGTEKTFGQFEPVTQFSNGGMIRLFSETGSLFSHAQSRINLSTKSPEAKAGSLHLTARSGSANLAGEILADQFNSGSGELNIQLGTLDAAPDLLSRLSQQGFNERFSFRLAQGDLLLERGKTLDSHAIDLVAEGGALRVDGVLSASGEQGGEIRLTAANNIVLGEQARLEAKALLANNDGGSVIFQNQMAGSNGGIIFNNTQGDSGQRSQINVSGSGSGKSGQVRFITAMADSKADVKIEGEVDILGAGFVEVSPHLRVADGSLTQNDLETASKGFEALFANENLVKNRLESVFYQDGLRNKDGIQLRPVLELYSQGSLSLAEDINMSGIRFGNNQQSAELWLRSAEQLSVSNNIYTGVRTIIPQVFFPPYSYQISPIEEKSWSVSLVSGADIFAADYRQMGAQPHALVVQDGANIVSGTGDVALYSSGDIVLKNGASIKSIGHAQSFFDAASLYGYSESFSLSPFPDSGPLSYAETLELFTGGVNFAGLRAAFFGEDGGNISLYAKNKISGNGIDQLDTEWRYRANDTYQFDVITGGTPRFERIAAVGIDYDDFDTGIGTLGGGNIYVEAGGNVENLLLAAPTVAKPVLQNEQPQFTGGGDIVVNAGGSINTSSYMVSDGRLSLTARDQIGMSAGQDIATLITYGNASIAMKAGGNVELNGAISEFLTPVSQRHYDRMDSKQAYWVDQNAKNSIHLESTTGGIYFNTYDTETQSPTAQIYSDNLDSTALSPWEFYALLPKKVSATSFSSDIHLEQNLYVMPGIDSRIALMAKNNIIAASDRTLETTLTTSLKHLPSSGLPDVTNPYRGKTKPEFLKEINNEAKDVGRVFEQEYTEKSLLIADSGDIIGQNDWILDLEKEAYIEAGRDIVSPKFALLHNDKNLVSRVIAGRDLVIPTKRNPLDGSLSNSSASGGVVLEGPGILVVQAGRDINLGSSLGLRTKGNINNNFLADEGADLYVLAGLSSQVDVDNFSTLYGQNDNKGKPQDLYLYDLFLEELKVAGAEGVSNGTGVSGFDQAYGVIDSLFPGSTDKRGDWAGDISLVFSTLQTEDGGDVKIFTPGGGVDVGLTSNLIRKAAADLGIFTKTNGSIYAFSEGSIEVNLSRIFALNGGDVMLWSSNGDIDAGKGARSAQSLPPPLVTITEEGDIKVTFSAAIDGSGIGGFTQPGTEPGDVFLFAPRGVVDAGEAGIRVEGNLQIGGELLNADNVDVGGVSVGVPTDTGVSAGMAGLGSLASSSTDSATENVSGSSEESNQQQAAFLTVEIIGLGD